MDRALVCYEQPSILFHVRISQILVLTKRFNVIRSNEIRIRRELPVFGLL